MRALIKVKREQRRSNPFGLFGSDPPSSNEIDQAHEIAAAAGVQVDSDYRAAPLSTYSEEDVRPGVRQAVRSWFLSNDWDTRWAIVTQVHLAERATFLTSGEESTGATFELSGKVIALDQGSPNLAAGFTLSAQLSRIEHLFRGDVRHVEDELVLALHLQIDTRFRTDRHTAHGYRRSASHRHLSAHT